MAIDPNIILAGQGRNTFNPMQSLAQGLNLRQMVDERQFQQAERARAEQARAAAERDATVARQVWANSGGDESKVLKGLQGAGLYKQYQSAAKAFDDRRKAGAAAGKDEAETRLKGQEYLRSFATRLAAAPTPETAINLLASAAASGEISREQAQSIGDQLEGVQPAQWGRTMMSLISKPDEWLALNTPKITTVNDGQQTQFVDTNAFTNPTQGPIQMQASPEAMLTDARGKESNRISAWNASTSAKQLAETQRHNRAGEANAAGQLTVAQRNAAAREAEVGAGGRPPQGYIWGPGGGSLVPIPGGPGDPKMRGLNENQSNAGTFGGRMAAAGDVLNAVGQDGKVQPSLVKRVADSVPVIGGALGMAANSVFASPQQQQIEQAERDFINATLRRESGAAIGPGEFANARQQYFPQPGDSKEVVAQKLANRQRATQSMLQVVPEAFRQDYTAGTTLAGPQQPAPTAQPAQRPPQPAQQQPAQQFKALPMPQQYAGKRIRDDRTGQILRSDGKNWVPEGR